MDTQWYLDVNHFARQTAWAHGFMHFYALYGGVLLLAILVVVGFWRARGGLGGGGSAQHVAVVLWTAGGTLVALGLNQPLSHIVGRSRPYAVLHGVEVLVPRANDFTLPSDHATVAGAIIAGLWLSRDRLVAGLATLLGLFLAFARVYVGAHYPGDVLAGLSFGAVVVIAGYPLVVPLLRRGVEIVGRSPLGVVVGTVHRDRPAGPGPAARPTALGATGSVRILGGDGAQPRVPAGRSSEVDSGRDMGGS